jgi:hypothetical protein
MELKFADMMFVVAPAAAMIVFAVTLFTVTWFSNNR